MPLPAVPALLLALAGASALAGDNTPTEPGIVRAEDSASRQTRPAAALSDTVAVLDFATASAETNRWAWAEGGVADLLQIELQQHGLVMLDRDLIHAVLSEQRLAASGAATRDYLELSRLLNARRLIAGRVIPLDAGRFRVEASAFSVEAIETIVTAAAEGAFPNELSPVLRTVADQLTRKLQLAARHAPEADRPGAAPKPEALVMFYRGINACARGQPELAAPWFINAADLDADFTAPLLWEIKAYEMAGFERHAAIRREETAAVLHGHGPDLPGQGGGATRSGKLVLAVLDPVLDSAAKTYDSALAVSLTATLKEALLATGRVRLFAFENIGAAVAEQDLTLSSLFASQYAPRYGRWLASDALVLCRLTSGDARRVALDLALVNPLNAATITRIERTGPAQDLPAAVRAAAAELVQSWMNRPAEQAQALPSTKLPSAQVEDGGVELRPAFRGLAAALVQVRREPNRSDFHHGLADAFASTGRWRLAALEIERCLKSLDIRGPDADITFLATHRWLFWEPSPASGAAGLAEPRLIEGMMQQLLDTYPQSLAAGCLHYNLAVTALHTGHWQAAAEHALRARQILEPLPPHDVLEKELIAATFLLEGASLKNLGREEPAKSVFQRGLDYVREANVRDVCLPLGPAIGHWDGAKKVLGYGGDPPGIPTRLETELAALEGKPAPSTRADLRRDAKEIVSATNAPSAGQTNWLQMGQLYCQDQRYRDALDCYRKAVAKQIPLAQCPGLKTALLEVALDRNLSHPAEEFQKLRRELGFPLVEPSWVEWFAAGRKYQTSRQFDLDKAVACYSNMIEFLENPEKGGFYHLKKQPEPDRVFLTWGPTLAEMDPGWSGEYDSRWYSAAFYLARCLIDLGRKEEAAQWLRRIALKGGGDQFWLLLEADWHSARLDRLPLGVAAAQMLKDLHEESGAPKFGQVDGPFKLPKPARRALDPGEPPAPNAEILRSLTNALIAAAQEPPPQGGRPNLPHPQLEAFVERYGHDTVPAVLSLLPDTGDPLLPRAGGSWDESALRWMLDRTATASDAPYVVAACPKHWGLIGVAARLDPEATAQVLAGEWRRQSESPNGLYRFDFISRIIHARLRRLYPLVLDYALHGRANSHGFLFTMDGVVNDEKSEELDSAFRQTLGSCLKASLQEKDYSDLARISQIALHHGVSQAIEALLLCEGSTPAQLLKDIRPYADLPAQENEAVEFLRLNAGKWQWEPARKKFTLPKEKNN